MISYLDNICTMIAKYNYNQFVSNYSFNNDINDNNKYFTFLPTLRENLSDLVRYRLRGQNLHQRNKLELDDSDYSESQEGILNFF